MAEGPAKVRAERIAFFTMSLKMSSPFTSSLMTPLASRPVLAFFMILVRMLPPIVITLPLFPMVNYLRINDTHFLLIVLYSTFFVSLSTYIMKAFIDQIPISLEEMAFVDGATQWQALAYITLPLTAQGIIAAAVFVFIFSWNEFLFAFIFTTTKAKTTPLIISEMLGDVLGVGVPAQVVAPAADQL